jgi:hypothetical protein
MNKMKFKIKAIEVKQSAKGVKYAIATVLNENNNEYNNVTLFEPYSSKEIGYELIGQLSPNDYKGKIGWKFLEERTDTLTPRRSPIAIKEAQDTKRKDIAVAQENRAEGVKIASTFRDATLITTAWFAKTNLPFHDEKDIERTWLQWRSWLWKHWNDEQEPF